MSYMGNMVDESMDGKQGAKLFLHLYFNYGHQSETCKGKKEKKKYISVKTVWCQFAAIYKQIINIDEHKGDKTITLQFICVTKQWRAAEDCIG